MFIMKRLRHLPHAIMYKQLIGNNLRKLENIISCSNLMYM